MNFSEHLALMQDVLDRRKPRPKRCRSCKRTGTYRCRVCGTDWCGHCGSARLSVDRRIPEEFWLTACCRGCREQDPARRH